MSEYTTPNLLEGTHEWSGDWKNKGQYTADGTYMGFSVLSKTGPWYGLHKEFMPEAGKAYTFSALAKVPAGKYVYIYLSNGQSVTDGYISNGELDKTNINKSYDDDGWHLISLTFTPKVAKRILARVESDGDYKISVCAYMLVEGTTPAAWAPAEGEELAGGGASMSANLWNASAATIKPDADGVYLSGKAGGLHCAITGTSALAENQTVHMGASLRGADAGYIAPYVGYMDAAGKKNWTGFPHWTPSAEWQRFEATCVVPSGMTIYEIGFNVSRATGDMELTNPVFSYGSGIPVAEETFTPFESAGHAQTTYATYSSQKILSDSITAEVNARAKTDGAVSELSSKLSQTAEGINVSLDRLAATDKQIHSWFDFGSDASGNPKLSMGSSSSPIVGEYSNTGTAYKSRSGATLLALDAANSTTTADHMLAKDIAIGKWQWVPTNSGNNLTLVWKG